MCRDCIQVQNTILVSQNWVIKPLAPGYPFGSMLTKCVRRPVIVPKHKVQFQVLQDEQRFHCRFGYTLASYADGVRLCVRALVDSGKICQRVSDCAWAWIKREKFTTNGLSFEKFSSESCFDQLAPILCSNTIGRRLARHLDKWPEYSEKFYWTQALCLSLIVYHLAYLAGSSQEKGNDRHFVCSI